MHPRTEQLLQQLDTNRSTLCAAVDSVPSALRDTHVIPDRWSVAEVLEHLTRVEENITRLIASKLSEARMTGALEPERESGPIPVTIDRNRILDRTRRITSGERSLPRGEIDSTSALAALEKTRESGPGLGIEDGTRPMPMHGA